MAATDLQMGWTGVQHGTTSINKVMSVQFTLGANLQSYGGDNVRWDTVVVNAKNSLGVTVSSGNEAVLAGLAGGQVGTFTATHKDAKLASGGDIVFTCLNVVTGEATVGGGHAEFGAAQLNMTAFSSDGFTSPLSFTRGGV